MPLVAFAAKVQQTYLRPQAVLARQNSSLKALHGNCLMMGQGSYGLKNAVSLAGGVVIRYRQLYGPGTYYESELPGQP